MTTNLEYALLAANTYAASGAVVSDENTIPIPTNSGWSQIAQRNIDATGFLARAYRNTTSGEIVISRIKE